VLRTEVADETPAVPRSASQVGNHETTGTTIAACRRALGWGSGLVFAAVSRAYRSNPNGYEDFTPAFHEDAPPYPIVQIYVARLLR
jgi:hypothetical protein